jgi:hypothetical protein
MSGLKRTRGLRPKAPPDPGIKAGGIRERAMQSVRLRPESLAKSAASIRYWLRDKPAHVIEAKVQALAAKLGRDVDDAA